MSCDWFKKSAQNVVPLIPKPKSPAKVMEDLFRGFIGKHEDGNSNRAPWLDVIEKRAGLIGQPWCAIIIFWEIIPSAEQVLGKKSLLIPCAGVRKGAELNKKHLHKFPMAGDVGYLGTIGSWTGHQVFVYDVGRDEKGLFYLTIEGNTKASDSKNRNGGEVATHKRYLGDQSDGFEELGFATPFPS